MPTHFLGHSPESDGLNVASPSATLVMGTSVVLLAMVAAIARKPASAGGTT
jgi:hypothetical protein